MRAIHYILDDEKAFKKVLQDGRIGIQILVESGFRHISMGKCLLNSGSNEVAANIACKQSIFAVLRID